MFRHSRGQAQSDHKASVRFHFRRSWGNAPRHQRTKDAALTKCGFFPLSTWHRACAKRSHHNCQFTRGETTPSGFHFRRRNKVIKFEGRGETECYAKQSINYGIGTERCIKNSKIPGFILKAIGFFAQTQLH